jgi:hypothetical protein
MSHFEGFLPGFSSEGLPCRMDCDQRFFRSIPVWPGSGRAQLAWMSRTAHPWRNFFSQALAYGAISSLIWYLDNKAIVLSRYLAIILS